MSSMYALDVSKFIVPFFNDVIVVVIVMYDKLIN
jgi:hypothetical protein